MEIHRCVEVSAVDVVEAMIDDPEFGMDILAGLALRADDCSFHEGDNGSDYHSRVASFLEATACGLRAHPAQLNSPRPNQPTEGNG